MDEEMVRRWRQGLAPFDGLLVGTDDCLPLPILRAVLIAVGRRLQHSHPEPHLLTLQDWHEHDGYVNSARSTSWQELWETLASDDRLYASRSSEDEVSNAFFPEDRSFYWRYHLLDEYEEPDDRPGRQGWFDVTCAEPLARDLVEAIRAKGVTEITVEPAKQYFDRFA